MVTICLGSYKPSNELMLNFYGNYKRVMEGECNISKPWGLVAAAKWQAWKDASAFSRDEAMQKYIDAVIEVRNIFNCKVLPLLIRIVYSR